MSDILLLTGRITEESMYRYEEFLENVGKMYADSSRYRIHRCLEHQGFAHAVKHGAITSPKQKRY